MERKDHSLIDTESLYESKTSDLSPLSSDCCIYKVPNRLRIIKSKAYTPQVVSIGPYHHGNEALIAMEEHKWRYLRHFIDTYYIPIQHFIRIVKRKEDKIRAYYGDHITHASDDLTLIVMLDAVFIIGILLRFFSKEFENKYENDRIYYKPWMIQHIVPDLQLLENQIPFFIVEEIYEGIKRFVDLGRKLSIEEGELPMQEKQELPTQVITRFYSADEVRRFDKADEKLCIEEQELPMKKKVSKRVSERWCEGSDSEGRCLPTKSLEAVLRLKTAGDGAVSVRRSSITEEREQKERQSLRKLKVPTIAKAVPVRRFSITEEKDEKEGRFLKKMKVPTITKLHCSGVKIWIVIARYRGTNGRQI